MKPEIDTSILKSISFISDEGTKLEGEACGSCFSPSTNFTNTVARDIHIFGRNWSWLAG